MGQRGINRSPDATNTSFDDSNVTFAADEVQTAIEELENLVQGTSKGFTFIQYNGNANTGRYLEFFVGISSDDAPLAIVTPLKILTIVSRTTSTNDTCTMGYYDISGGLPGTLLYTSTFSTDKEVIESNPTGLFTVPANGKLALKVDSGSIQKPHIYFVSQGV